MEALTKLKQCFMSPKTRKHCLNQILLPTELLWPYESTGEEVNGFPKLSFEEGDVRCSLRSPKQS